MPITNLKTNSGSLYLDNAASTSLHPEVLDAMLPYYKQHFGNPSSIHSFGKKNRAAIEHVRKKIGELFHTASKNVVFCSSGSEANNMIINNAVNSLGIKHIITTEIEHKCVLNTIKHVEHIKECAVHYCKLNENGVVDLTALEQVLTSINQPFLISIMHVQNEIGSINPIHEIALLAKKYKGYFHTDTVQSIGKYNINLSELPIDFITGSAHKFHGPLGAGFLIKANNEPFDTWIYGGGQERNIRSGTENYPGIVGLGKALELAYNNLEENKHKILELKNQLKNGLLELFGNEISFNGGVNTSPWILSVNFPNNFASDMLFIKLDLEGIAVSGGSACASGALKKSDVLAGIKLDENLVTLRFSFSIFNNFEEIKKVIDVFNRLKNQK